MENKSFIFFSDFDIRRIMESEHLLINVIFIYPKNYMQNIIIYHDIIIEKMRSRIFIII